MWGPSSSHNSSTHVRGATMHVRGGEGATTHISTKSSESEDKGGVVQRRLELPTSYVRKGGGAVWWRLELPTLWRDGGGAVWLE
jgi:hypothetical protein